LEKNQRRTSAGRVQSVSVRLIVEREREIQNFKAATYSVVAEFTNEAGKSLKPNCLKNFNTKKEAEDF
jgi:DNA topoisomerase-1